MTVEGPLEIELKYRVASSNAGERLLNGARLGSFEADGEARTVRSEDRYIDTRGGALARAGYAARLRRERSSTVVTVKSLGHTQGALQRRTELEGPADRSLIPSGWPHSPARSFILEVCGNLPLEELVTIRQARQKRNFRDGDSLVELSLDEVKVIARGQQVDRFTEVEVELLSGAEAPLLELRSKLDSDADLTPSTSSKLDAALAAARGVAGGHQLAAPVRIPRATGRGGGEPTEAGAGDPRADEHVAGGPIADAHSADENGAAQPFADEGAGQKRLAGQRAEGDRAASDGGAEERRADEGGAEKGGADQEKGGADQDNAGAAVPAPGVERRRPRGADQDNAGAAVPARSVERRRPRGVDEAVPAPGVERRRPRGVKSRRADDEPRPEPPALIVGKTPGVTSSDVVAEAGRKVLRFHLARLIAREPGTRSGEDPEELHGMRVATRRMRAAWRVFGDGFRPESTKRFRNRLRDVARKLGAVRDIDVLVIALEEYRASLTAAEGAALEPLLDDWRAEREAGRVVLTRELDSDGYRRFVDDYRAFVLTPGAGALVVSPTDPHHVRDTAGSHIWRAYENVLAYGHVLRWADVPTLHQLRIAGKWLRYTLEFVAEALGPDAKPLIERVVAMQDHLGLMNDAEVAAMKARAHLVARTGMLTDAETAAVARYLASREREVARLKRGASAPWRSLASPAFRRGLGRAVATLAASPSGSATGS